MRLKEKVDFLRRRESYPGQTGAIRAIETHISWVFLTDAHAYKLKKPVRYPFLDFRTIDARHIDSLDEVRLNRRLAGDVYLGVVPMSIVDGSPRLGGDGSAVDWLVKMRRLPLERMLDQLIEQRKIGPGGIRSAAQVLARFYRGQPAVEIAPHEYRRRLQDDIDENESELSDGAFPLPADRIHQLCRRQRALIESAAPLFDERVRQGRIVEGHGDLRPEHVCMLESPVIIDCLEFRRQFRILDAADELAYLGLECERLGAPWVVNELFETYREITGDHPADVLIHFHASVRACLRAKLAIWHNRDHGRKDPERWVLKAMSYLQLAEEHAERFSTTGQCT
jgi:aminoglycoside phosphotransferase family enzyme